MLSETLPLMRSAEKMLASSSPHPSIMQGALAKIPSSPHLLKLQVSCSVRYLVTAVKALNSTLTFSIPYPANNLLRHVLAENVRNIGAEPQFNSLSGFPNGNQELCHVFTTE